MIGKQKWELSLFIGLQFIEMPAKLEIPTPSNMFHSSKTMASLARERANKLWKAICKGGWVLTHVSSQKEIEHPFPRVTTTCWSTNSWRIDRAFHEPLAVDIDQGFKTHLCYHIRKEPNLAAMVLLHKAYFSSACCHPSVVITVLAPSMSTYVVKLPATNSCGFL